MHGNRSSGEVDSSHKYAVPGGSSLVPIMGQISVFGIISKGHPLTWRLRTTETRPRTPGAPRYGAASA